MFRIILTTTNVGLGDIAEVGGKNASLGEMMGKMRELEIRIPDGFVLKVEAFWRFMKENELIEKIGKELDSCNLDIISDLQRRT